MTEQTAEIAVPTGRTGKAFGSRLVQAKADFGPLCVGIDPHASELTAWGLPDNAGGFRDFALRMLDAAAGRAAAVKPQSLPDERVDYPGYLIARDRPDAKLPPARVHRLGELRLDAGVAQQVANHRRAAIALAAAPADVDSEAAVLDGPDGQAVGAGGSKHLAGIDTFCC